MTVWPKYLRRQWRVGPGKPASPAGQPSTPTTPTTPRHTTPRQTKAQRRVRQCPICGIGRRWLAKHLRSIHNVNPASAKINRTKWPETSVAQVRQEGDPRPFRQCPFCEYASVRLDKHLLRMHKERPEVSDQKQRHQMLKEASVVARAREATVAQDALSDAEDQTPSVTTTPAPLTPPLPEAAAVAEAQPQTDIPKLLDRFQTWMSVVCAYDMTRCKYQANMVRTIISKTNKPLDNLLEFMEDLETNWLAPAKAKATASGEKGTVKTVKNYLFILLNFIKFIGLKTPIQDTEKVKDLLGVWQKNLNRSVSCENAALKEKQKDEIVTPTMVKEYHCSERARTATKALGSLMEVMSPLSPGLFCRVRNYLMVSLCLQNANRGGILSKLTHGDLQKAKKASNGVMILTCIDHKTVQTSGSAKVGLSEKLHKMLQLFAEAKQLMGLPSGSLDPLFVGRKGAAMTSSNVATAVATDLMAAGTPFRATTNRIRHSVVSILTNLMANEGPELAAFMCHSTRMQRDTYDSSIRTNKAARMSTIVNKIMAGELLSEDDITDADCEIASFDMAAARHNLPLSLQPPPPPPATIPPMLALPPTPTLALPALPAASDPAKEQHVATDIGATQPRYKPVVMITRLDMKVVHLCSNSGTIPVSMVDQDLIPHTRKRRSAEQAMAATPKSSRPAPPPDKAEDTLLRAAAILKETGVLAALVRDAQGYDVPGMQSAMAAYNGILGEVDTLWLHAEDVMDLETFTVAILRSADLSTLNDRERLRFTQLAAAFVVKRIEQTTTPAETLESLASASIIAPSTQMPHPHRRWSEEARETIRAAFKDEVGRFGAKTVRAALATNPGLKARVDAEAADLTPVAQVKCLIDTCRNLFPKLFPRAQKGTEAL